MQTNKELDLAFSFIENTDRNLFLTGKAGTGKTTFLHKIKHESLKRMIVVAPTGVAAINAKGVTIHSFFQMPFGPILPNTIQNNTSFQHKFSRNKIDIIKSLDLVIIDEISMVRADLLDGIDTVLRRYRDRTKVFGGLQLLMIGDLHQLSPVVKPNEWNLLKPHYQNAFFFSSKAYMQANVVCVELKHIYRQENEDFIALLNDVRNDTLTPKSAEQLNSRYQPDFTSGKDDGYITLTTHNNRANKINDAELQKLDTTSSNYNASVSGKFSEHSYPNHKKLELKVGAQVMFIKNDSSIEKRYYNGKIGTVVNLDDDAVLVQCKDEDELIETTYETWENISYTINDETKEIKEDVTGSFSQIPLRLAWAITIHKSQGLTFQKAIIDAEASFAHGQTYVALSRCTSLEGLVLKTPINSNSIISDNTVNSFTEKAAEQEPNQQDLKASQKTFQLNLITDLFNFYQILYPLKRMIDIYYANRNSFEGNIIIPLENIKDKGIVPLIQVSIKFKNQLQHISLDVELPETDTTIQERFKKALHYFLEQTETHIKTSLEGLTFSIDNKAVKKDFSKQLQSLEDKLEAKLFCLKALQNGFKVTNYLKARAASVLQEPKTKKKTYKTTTKHTDLFEDLRLFRESIANSEDIPHFQVFTQKTLYELCEMLPTTTKQLKAIHGMGKIRVQKYGKEIIDLILEYCDTNEVEPKADTKPKPKTDTKKVSYDLYKNGLTIEAIAKERDFATTTIEGHLATYVASGDIDVLELVTKEKFKIAKKAIASKKYNGLSELKAHLDDSFSYGELRMIVNALEKKQNTD
jgi:hypothetical protein